MTDLIDALWVRYRKAGDPTARTQLLDRSLRGCTAALIDETLAVLGRADIHPAALDGPPPQALPRLMRLPTPLFRLLAGRKLRIDPQARSSMADDLALGRTTEVDAICGAVVRLARQHGLAAPLNARMVDLLSVPKPQPVGGKALRQLLGL